MIVYHDEYLKFKEILKFNKFLDHYREQARVSFLKKVINDYLENPTEFLIDLWVCEYQISGDKWKIKYTNEKCEGLDDFVYSFIHTSAFKNFELNENVYFYRYLNIIREIVGTDRLYDILENIKGRNSTLDENINEYLKYRQKVIEIIQVNNERIEHKKSKRIDIVQSD